jgi:hypothetical protein
MKHTEIKFYAENLIKGLITRFHRRLFIFGGDKTHGLTGIMAVI